MRTLVLNAGYEPLAVVSFKRAVVLVLNAKAIVILCDDERPVHAASGSYDRPSVIVLTRYVKIPRSRLAPLSRRGILRRDGQRCCYCGHAATTIDHVLPKSRGGGESWENLVACCLGCNNKKGDRTPAEMGWAMRVNPAMPRHTAWMARGMESAEPQWGEYLAPVAA